MLDCYVSDERADIEVDAFGDADGGDARVIGPDAAQPFGSRNATFDGVVRQVEESEFVVDTCAPNADCSEALRRVRIASPGLNLQATLGAGALVHVAYVKECFNGCLGSIFVTSLNTWGGLKNRHNPPTSPLYVAADERGVTDSGAPYTWDTVRLDCKNATGGSCGGPNPAAGVYALRFEGSRLIQMGETATVAFFSGGLQVRNLRSFISGLCDDDRNFAYWAMPVQLGD
jgi:hypothetical protein